MKLIFAFLILIPLQSYGSIDFDGFTVEKEISWPQLDLNDTSTLRAAFESPSKQSTFTIRDFQNLKEKSLKKNVKSWLKDYRSYGFSITNKMPLKLNDKTYGFLIEALHKRSGKIFKQYMTIQEDRLVTLTCHSQRVDAEFKLCSESLISFMWKKDAL